MMFKATTKYNDVELVSKQGVDYYPIPETDDVLTTNGWKKAKELVVGDVVCGDETNDTIKDIRYNNKNYYLLIGGDAK